MIELNIMRANTPLPDCKIEWYPVNSQFFTDYEIDKAVEIAHLLNKVYASRGIQKQFKIRLLAIDDIDFTVTEIGG